jgi:UDP-glucuronate 4-epimerase
MALFLFTKAILDGEPIQVFNDGKMIRDFTYIDDIVSGIKGAILNPSKANEGNITKLQSSTSSAPYRIFNLGNNQPVTLENFINAIEVSTGKKAIKEYLPMQPGDVQKTFANIDKAGECLGFAPSTSIEEGVKKFVDWYIKYYER